MRTKPAAIPTTGQIERELRNGRNVQRAICTRTGRRDFKCRLVFSDQPDGRATVHVRRDGIQIIGYDTGTQRGPGTSTLPVP